MPWISSGNPMQRTKDPGAVIVVTVTYGNRRHLLERLVRQVVAEGVGRIVVVDNGSTWDVQSIANSGEQGRIDVVQLMQNKGSAAGYAAGIKRALATHAEFIWLLDDDNVPEQGCLKTLLEGYRSLGCSDSPAMLSVAALRPDLVAIGYEYASCAPRRLSGRFINFHFLDIPAKIWRQIAKSARKNRNELALNETSDVTYIQEAPYSGLLLHRSTIARIGLPRADFVLYMDDSEFTRRFTDSGGRLVLLRRARVLDVERNVSGDGRWIFRALRNWDNWRTYYTYRNLVWMDNHPRRYNGHSIIYRLNMVTWLCIHLFVAILTGRLREFSVLIDAVRDGDRGRMGMSEKYPLG